MVESAYKGEICDLIRAYNQRSQASQDRISDFLQANGLEKLEDCNDIKALDLLCRIETFMAIESLRVRTFV